MKFRDTLFRHETVLAVVLILEWFYFSSVGPRFGSLDNNFDILLHTVEIGLLALVMTPVILTGGIDLSVGSLMALLGVLFFYFLSGSEIAKTTTSTRRGLLSAFQRCVTCLSTLRWGYEIIISPNNL